MATENTSDLLMVSNKKQEKSGESEVKQSTSNKLKRLVKTKDQAEYSRSDKLSRMKQVLTLTEKDQKQNVRGINYKFTQTELLLLLSLADYQLNDSQWATHQYIDMDAINLMLHNKQVSYSFDAVSLEKTCIHLADLNLVKYIMVCQRGIVPKCFAVKLSESGIGVASKLYNKYNELKALEFQRSTEKGPGMQQIKPQLILPKLEAASECMIFEVTEPKEKAQDADRSSDEDDHTPLMMIDDHSMTYNASFYNEDTTTQLASPSTKKNQNQNEKKRSQSKKKRKAVFERVINKDGTGFRIKNKYIEQWNFQMVVHPRNQKQLGDIEKMANIKGVNVVSERIPVGDVAWKLEIVTNQEETQNFVMNAVVVRKSTVSKLTLEDLEEELYRMKQARINNIYYSIDTMFMKYHFISEQLEQDLLVDRKFKILKQSQSQFVDSLFGLGKQLEKSFVRQYQSAGDEGYVDLYDKYEDFLVQNQNTKFTNQRQYFGQMLYVISKNQCKRDILETIADKFPTASAFYRAMSKAASIENQIQAIRDALTDDQRMRITGEQTRFFRELILTFTKEDYATG